jgi:hypothetical protein
VGVIQVLTPTYAVSLSVGKPNAPHTNRYRTVQVETADGKLYQGLVIYEAVDSLILQTGPTDTIRLDGSQVAGVRPTDVSLMPAGLLDMLRDKSHSRRQSLELRDFLFPRNASHERTSRPSCQRKRRPTVDGHVAEPA